MQGKNVKKSVTLRNYMRHVWKTMPIRKMVMGQEMIDDIAMLCVQFWPDDELRQCDDGTTEEVQALVRLSKKILMNLEFLWGEHYEGYRHLGLQRSVLGVINITCDWWRRSPRNRTNIIVWRRKWVEDGTEK